MIVSDNHYHIYDDYLQYISPYRKDRFITVENFRNKRLNDILR